MGAVLPSMGDRRRPPGAAHRHRVQAPPSSLIRRRRGGGLRRPQAPGVGQPARRRPVDRAQRRPQAPVQDRRRSQEPQIYPQRAWPRLPHAWAGSQLMPGAGRVAAGSAHRRRRPDTSHRHGSLPTVSRSPSDWCCPSFSRISSRSSPPDCASLAPSCHRSVRPPRGASSATSAFDSTGSTAACRSSAFPNPTMEYAVTTCPTIRAKSDCPAHSSPRFEDRALPPLSSHGSKPKDHSPRFATGE